MKRNTDSENIDSAAVVSRRDEGLSSKRRRWNGGGGVGAGNDVKKNDDPSRSGMDLADMTQGRGDTYGYLSSESDEGGATINSSAGGRARRSRQRRARMEQRSGARSFRIARRNDNNDDPEGDGKKVAALPTPGGWTRLANKRDPAIAGRVKTPRPHTDVSKSSGFTLSSGPGANADQRNNPYASKPAPTKTPAIKSTNASSSVPSTARRTRASKPRTTHHLVCAVSENLARETCVASMDAGRPTYLHITKQGNGQTYAETMSLLRMLNPDEVLLNEGRRNSQLAKKIMTLFGQEMVEGAAALVGVTSRKDLCGKKGGKGFKSNVHDARGCKSRFASRVGGNAGDAGDDLTSANLSSACETSTVVKFVPRSYFDQTRGAEMLRKLARGDAYDAALVEEYILLSSSHAVLQYAQLCLGAGLTRGSLTLDVNVGGNHRMNIDRSTMTNLELLVNAKTGRTANSLVGTIDCTKTSVGGRLLRTNLMAPPTRLDTINARLDLVDSLLEDEEFFYVVMEHLEDLPDVDKMLTYVSLAPRRRFDSGNGGLFGNAERQTVTARIASKGISALVCIKSTLSAIPSFANVLEVQLKELDERDDVSLGVTDATVSHGGISDKDGRRYEEAGSGREDDESTTVVESEMSSENEGDSSTMDDANDTFAGGTDTAATRGSSLQIGLGTSSANQNDKARIPAMRQARNQLLRAILIAMRQPALSRVLNAVMDIFTESTTYSKNSHAMRHQECFALRPNTDGMMDVLRKAFLANVDDIYRLADEYAETYDITVQVKETASRGYYLSVSADLGLDLPQMFIQPVKNGRFIHCTTEEIYSLNSRAQENVQDLLLMTHGRIQEVLQVARDNYDCIASLSDAIALLDMCHCFADNVASSRLPWCRPVLSDHDRGPGQEAARVGGGGAIAIRNGRYAIDVSMTGVTSSLDGGDFVPNDTYSSALQNFTVITGINGSGKSTYLKQIALIVILAHCGSYVPADEAFLPIRDQICTRIGTSDDQEHNISTFLLEMKETAFICNSTTDKSLFLLDELGRATSNEDGVAVAWSVSEYLLTKRAMTFFVTHYPQISKLAEMYPNVQNQHLGSQISSSSNGETSSISYTHKILPGPCKSAGDYGVEMAVTCGWPDDAVRNARWIRNEVKRKMPGEDILYNENSKKNENVAEGKRRAHNILCDIAKHLAAMKEGEGKLSEEAKKNYLQELRNRLVPTNNESLVRIIRNLLLNVDETVPPLTRPRPVDNIGIADIAPGTDLAAVEEDATTEEIMAKEDALVEKGLVEAVPDQTKRYVTKDDASMDEPHKKVSTVAPTTSWKCELSPKSSDESSMHTEEEHATTSQNDGTSSTPNKKGRERNICHRLQPKTPLKHSEVEKEAVQKKIPPSEHKYLAHTEECLLEYVAHSSDDSADSSSPVQSTSGKSRTSSSSSESDSTSSSTSNNTSDISSVSPSNSSSSSSGSSMYP